MFLSLKSTDLCRLIAEILQLKTNIKIVVKHILSTSNHLKYSIKIAKNGIVRYFYCRFCSSAGKCSPPLHIGAQRDLFWPFFMHPVPIWAPICNAGMHGTRLAGMVCLREGEEKD